MAAKSWDFLSIPRPCLGVGLGNGCQIRDILSVYDKYARLDDSWRERGRQGGGGPGWAKPLGSLKHSPKRRSWLGETIAKPEALPQKFVLAGRNHCEA